MNNDKIEEMVEQLAVVFDDGYSRPTFAQVDFFRTTLTTFADEIRNERVTHCDDINCPECNKASYEAGAKAERAMIVEWSKQQRAILRDERTEYDVPATEEYKRGFATALNSLEFELTNLTTPRENNQ